MDREDTVKLAGTLTCPECGEPIWDLPTGSKFAKCWNAREHESGGTLAFDTMPGSDSFPEDGENLGSCQWFALCPHKATHLHDHIILGSVPACDRCPTIGA